MDGLLVGENMSKFSDISAQLDKNITEVELKKKAVDAATAALTKAGEEYQRALETGVKLKNDLLAVLNESLPQAPKNKIG